MYFLTSNWNTSTLFVDPLKNVNFVEKLSQKKLVTNTISSIIFSRLPDDPNLIWNKRLVSDIIMKQVECLGIDTIISFDSYGVSGHRNHIAIFRALQSLYSQGKLPTDTQVRLFSCHIYCKSSSN